VIRLALAAALTLLVAAPASAQSIGGCAIPPTNQVATTTDRAAFQRGIDCIRKAQAIGDASIARRQKRLDALDKIVTSPKPPLQAPYGAVPAAIASNSDRGALLSSGLPTPASGKPDVVGAFRFICQPSHEAADDPILWPGQPGKAHLHQFFGNTGANAYSTFTSLRTTGDSTCMNRLNRSAYWYPAMLTGKGEVIRADYISIYYKRRPASDPECRKLAAKGCVNLPNGLKLVADVNHFRCVANQFHRATLEEALADCGGRGQVMAAVNFGSCWNGKTESADARSHVVAFARDQNSGRELCPAGYGYVIPELTQGIAWTIEPGDGAVHFSAPTFHADYMTAWDQPTLDTAEANCLDKLLTCVDGELGDGAIMKRWAGFGYTANPRVVPAPAGYSMAAMVH
jgi:hypothetical protein